MILLRTSYRYGVFMEYYFKLQFSVSWSIGYEPAGLTVHPPPRNDRGWVHFFRMGV